MEPEDLYGLPLDRFIAERGALVKALRADKRREEAAQVTALRKPSVAAWAVNQLVRTQGDAVRELFDAGDGLREAQADLLGGRGDGRTLRAANERERDAVDALVEAARGLLSSDGHELSPAVVERVSDTLHAAALDAAAREQVRDGRLERELRHAGLGLGESPGPASAPATAKPRPTPAKRAAPAKPAKPAKADKPEAGPSREEAAEARRAAREQAKREQAEREQAERERAEARKAARTAEVAARRRAERAGHALKAAGERRARAAHALEQADAALAAAQAEAQEAVDAQRAAQAEFEQLS